MVVVSWNMEASRDSTAYLCQYITFMPLINLGGDTITTVLAFSNRASFDLRKFNGFLASRIFTTSRSGSTISRILCTCTFFWWTFLMFRTNIMITTCILIWTSMAASSCIPSELFMPLFWTITAVDTNPQSDNNYLKGAPQWESRIDGVRHPEWVGHSFFFGICMTPISY